MAAWSYLLSIGWQAKSSSGKWIMDRYSKEWLWSEITLMEYVNDRVRGLNVVGIAVAFSKCLPGYTSMTGWWWWSVMKEQKKYCRFFVCRLKKVNRHRKRVFVSLLIESDLNDPLGEETIAWSESSRWSLIPQKGIHRSRSWSQSQATMRPMISG